jgi:hypothetical protein
VLREIAHGLFGLGQTAMKGATSFANYAYEKVFR